MDQVANFILAKKVDLQLNIPKLKLHRNDLLEVGHKILAMSPTERRELGINMSTFRYQKRNLISGKTIKIYQKVVKKFHY